MRIAVLSGKGGTGKTLVSVNLAAASGDAVYIDCDVEEPNGHLFFQPEIVNEETVSVPIPVVDENRCDGCRACIAFCRFNAIAFAGNKPLLFPEVCHACGGCVLVCPNRAIYEENRNAGVIQSGRSGSVETHTGVLNPGEASGVPLIRALLRKSADERERPIWIDCPPGTACTAMESIRGADYCVLVAEPTVFGQHNLKMVCELASVFHKPFGVLINKCTEGGNPIEVFCAEQQVHVLGRIPFERQLGELSSNARIAVRESERYRALFLELLASIQEEVAHETAAHPQR